MSRPLDGIRVLDLTQVLFGPFCTMLLSNLGAEVIKIERPEGGDMARGNGPFLDGISSYFLSLNHDKKSITMNLASEQGKELLLKLTEVSDVVIQSFVPGTMDRLGLGYETVKKRNPRIIYVCGSGFGQYGPYARKPAFDVIIQAMGGVMSITGEPGRPPVRPGVSYGDIVAGMFMCIATLAAVQERNRSGTGQMVDISMLDCQVTVLENAFVRYLNTGEIPRPLGTRHPVIAPFQAFPTKDGYIAVAMRGGVKDQWPLFCAVIGRLEIMDDPRFKTGWLRTQNYDALEPILNEAIKDKTTAEWIQELEQADIPCGPVNTIPQVAADPQVQARNMFAEIEHPKAGKLRVVNTPFKFSRNECRVEKASPELGEHTEEILTGLLGMTVEEVGRLREQQAI
ncbi:MAG: CaiB/BaiF CoA-transferase family protein [Dehalococcoidia bacterium]|nr:CaiB/BaiF CoA-transferase family protein [Dehalococcoidia bacterium]